MKATYLEIHILFTIWPSIKQDKEIHKYDCTHISKTNIQIDRHMPTSDSFKLYIK
jgi:hypothetical protein